MSGKMKDSGIEWIGKIPEDWEVIRLKYSCKYTADKISLKTYNNQELLMYIGLEHVEQQTGRLVENYQPVYGFNGDTISFQKDDVLFGKLRPYLAKCLLADCNGKCSSEFFVLRSERNILPTYLRLIMLSKGFIEYVDSSTFGVKMPRAEWGFAKNIFIPLPSLPTQQRIVDYIDQKCAKIDRIVAAKQKQNELLKVYRQSVIYEAVIKGLDKNVKYKDSGIEWIGEIPDDREKCKIKYVCDVDKNRLSEDTDANYSFKYIDISSVTEMGGIGETAEMTFDASPSRARMIVSKGDTIISTVRTYLKAIAFIEESNKYICSTGFAVLTPKKRLLPRFLFYQTQSEYFIQEVVSKSVGVSYPAITSSALSHISIFVPPLPTQQRIADYLDQKCGEIDRIIKSNDDMIAKLKEYRQSVIYEAVTGKIEL